jgi:integrase
MPTISLYLDDRHVKKSGTCPLKFAIRNNGKSVYMTANIEIPPQCWRDGKVVTSRNAAIDALMPHPPKQMNIKIQQRLAEVQHITDQICGWKSNMDAYVLRTRIVAALSGKPIVAQGMENRCQAMTLMDCWDEIIQTKDEEATRQAYLASQSYVRRNVARADSILLEEIDEEWVASVLTLMRKGAKTQQALMANTVSGYYSRLKAVWHYAQRKRYVAKDNDPFVEHKATQAATRSRALTVEELRRIWNYKKKNLHHNALRNAAVGRDMFVLSFCLCGINMADLFRLREDDIRGGRLETDRKKTGVHINIKIEPEAQEIIDRYKKDGYLIGRLFRGRQNYVAASINRGLKSIMPEVTMYWARHTWVSLAVELDIPDRTVFMGIAHRQGKASDETYITMRNRKLDIANRKVIDYVLGKIEPEY